MKKLNIPTSRLLAQAASASEGDNEVTNMMLDPRYLRQSSSLIQDALQKGFDVLQLANGDIVMTGTKTVVYQYSWDSEKGKLAKAKPEKNKGAKRGALDENESEESEEEA